ncbi:MAG: hypothetical protein FWG29_05545 [Treponema sp.]|nr:hypothetical protein [Treponema sp.]
MAEVQTLPDYPRGLDFQQVWAALMEDRERLKETERILRENAEQFAQQQKETDRIVKENAKQQEETKRQQEETARQMKETDKQLGKLGNRFGDVIEYKYADLHNDKRTFLGAVAGVVISDNVRDYVLKQGFFVIEPSRGEPSPLCGSVEYTGETFTIIPPSGDPKEW